MASIRTLFDEERSWPKPGMLHLDGLIYQEISQESPHDPETRIEWLHRESGIDEGMRNYDVPLQPYNLLAAYYCRLGREDDASTVLIQKEWDIAEPGPGFLQWCRLALNRIYCYTVGYGYDPWRSSWCIFAMVGLGSMIFGMAKRHELIVASKSSGHLDPLVVQTQQDSPIFSPIIFALETLTPFVTPEQKEVWRPDASKGRSLGLGKVKLKSGELIRWYYWIHTIIGWALAAAIGAGLSGLLKTP